MSERVRISELPHHIGSTVTLQGWLTGLRSSGKIAFLQLRDGSGFVQGVLPADAVDEATFALARSLDQEAALEVEGEVVADERAPSGVEVQVKGLTPIAPGNEYPITPKEHGVDFLFEHRHLYLRHRGPWAILRIRDLMERAMHDFFAERGFVRFDAPFFMPTAVEGTTNLFEIDLFGEEQAYLSQSGQLYAEAGAMAFGKVYTFGPAFRAEKSKTRRHLLEFWMIEPEVAFLDHQGNMELQEELIAYLAGRVLEGAAQELAMLERDTTILEATANGGFPRLSYDDALAKLAEAGETLEWGDDFGAPHETILGNLYDRPVFIEAWPTKTKAFYMEPYEDDPTRVKCADLIAPEGYGEIIGGSQREENYDNLSQRINELKIPTEDLWWYLETRKFGTAPHSGFGLGFERLVLFITGMGNIRDVIPFPRTPKNAEF